MSREAGDVFGQWSPAFVKFIVATLARSSSLQAFPNGSNHHRVLACAAGRIMMVFGLSVPPVCRACREATISQQAGDEQ